MNDRNSICDDRSRSAGHSSSTTPGPNTLQWIVIERPQALLIWRNVDDYRVTLAQRAQALRGNELPVKREQAATAPLNYFTEKQECPLHSGPTPRQWRLVITLDDSGWWVFR